ncbi:MAG: hypothetical protein PF795_11160, partial [Kiritimatiellae bacterium]|nr:hypothetical protein [Kiritimatiellia bacterium]
MLAPQHDHLRLIDWNNLHLALEWVYQGSPLFKRRVVRHQIPGLSAWWVRKGRVTVSGPTVTVRGEVGDWIFRPYHEDERHFSDDAEILSIRFQANWGGDNELLQESEPRTCHGREVPILERRATALL